MGRVWLFDIQGWITLFLGGLLALITLFTSYSHVHLPFLGAIALNQQIGVLLLLALGRLWKTKAGCAKIPV